MEKTIETIFARNASVIDNPEKLKEPLSYLEERRAREMAFIFKRKALGLIKGKIIKDIDETAQLLYETGIASSVSEGLKAVPLITEQEILYWKNPIIGTEKMLYIEKIPKSSGNNLYKIQAYFNIFDE